jgi:hypothetical protein
VPDDSRVSWVSFAVADHLLDGHVADDRTQVTGEDVVDPLIHLILLIEETAR